MDWDLLVMLSSNFDVQVKGRELTLISKCGPLVDGWVEFRGEKINILFRPHAILMRADSKESSAEEITSRFSMAAACCLLGRNSR